MSEELTLRPIAHIHSDFATKFGVPRQSGLVEELTATIVFVPEFRDPEALRGLEDFSHLWLIWEFSHNRREGWSPTVRPPRLGGNQRMGVFATRSPFRPNPLGLSCVRLLGTEVHPELGHILRVAGADLTDGTPIFDIKPYLPYADCRPDALGGFTAVQPRHTLQVICDEALLQPLAPEKRSALLRVLAQDPRPSYQNDSQRIYGFVFAGCEVHFTVDGEILRVCGLAPASPQK